MCIGMVLACAGSAAIAEPFVYQGQLKESGALANGEFDFRFELYDAETGGTQIGATNAFGNLEVVDGVFYVDLDFGDFAFEGTDRWLRIQVRPGANVGSYTELQPRTQMSKAPQAQIADEALFADHAITAETLINPQWTDAPGILWYGDGNDRVRINRSTAIDSDSYFDVHADTGGDVGMLVSGLTNSDPFYGFAEDGTVRAIMEYDSSAGVWRLVNDGSTAMNVNSSGVVSFLQEINAIQNIQAFEYNYVIPKSRRVSVAAQTFNSPEAEPLDIIDGVEPVNGGDVRLVAPVHFPDGASLNRLRVWCTDVDPFGSQTYSLRRTDIETGNWGTVGVVTTVGIGGFDIELTDLLGNEIVDNSKYAYWLEADGIWGGTSGGSTRLQGVTVEYTVEVAD